MEYIIYLAVLYGAFVIVVLMLISSRRRIKINDAKKDTGIIESIVHSQEPDNKIVMEKSAATVECAKEIGQYIPDGLDYVFNIEKRGEENFCFSIKDYQNVYLGESRQYTTKSGCLKGMMNMKNFFNLVVLDNETGDKQLEFGTNVFEIKRDENGGLHFQIRNLNKTFFVSRNFPDKESCIKEIETLKKARFYNYYNDVD